MGELRIKLKESFQVLDYSAYWATLLVKFQLPSRKVFVCRVETTGSVNARL